MIKKVVNEFGENVEVNEETRKLYSFSNKNKKVVYSAKIVENGKETNHWTYYTESGKVEELEEKLKTWNNKLLLIYASAVDFQASKNDPGKEIYKAFVEYVKENESKFFTKTGDFRKKFLISDAEIKKMLTAQK